MQGPHLILRLSPAEIFHGLACSGEFAPVQWAISAPCLWFLLTEVLGTFSSSQPGALTRPLMVELALSVAVVLASMAQLPKLGKQHRRCMNARADRGLQQKVIALGMASSWLQPHHQGTFE